MESLFMSEPVICLNAVHRIHGVKPGGRESWDKSRQYANYSRNSQSQHDVGNGHSNGHIGHITKNGGANKYKEESQNTSNHRQYDCFEYKLK